jgi:hypothetical protein
VHASAMRHPRVDSRSRAGGRIASWGHGPNVPNACYGSATRLLFLA